MNRLLALGSLIVLLAVGACTETSARSYPTPAPIRPRDAATIVAQATDDTSATATARAQQAWDRDSTSTAVANAVTALALTPTAAALALRMQQAADAATAQAQATQAMRTATAVWQPTRAAETQVAQTRTATAQAGLDHAAAYDAARNREQQQAAQRRWDAVTLFVTVVVCASIAAAALIGMVYLAGLAWQRVQRHKFMAQQERAKALVELVRRSGQGMIRIDLVTGEVKLVQDNRGEPPAALPGVRELSHVPVVWNESPLTESPAVNAVLAVLDAAREYRQAHPGWPDNQIPRWDKLGLSATVWTDAVKALRDCLDVRPGKGTYVSERFADLDDLREQVARGTVPMP